MLFEDSITIAVPRGQIDSIGLTGKGRYAFYGSGGCYTQVDDGALYRRLVSELGIALPPPQLQQTPEVQEAEVINVDERTPEVQVRSIAEPIATPAPTADIAPQPELKQAALATSESYLVPFESFKGKAVETHESLASNVGIGPKYDWNALDWAYVPTQLRAGVASSAGLKTHCWNCGTAFLPDARFCSKCGKPRSQSPPQACIQCGARLGDDFTFCDQCGARQDVPASRAAMLPEVLPPMMSGSVAQEGRPNVQHRTTIYNLRDVAQAAGKTADNLQSVPGPETTVLSAPAAFPAQSTRSVAWQPTATEHLQSMPGPPTTMLPGPAAFPAQSTRSVAWQATATENLASLPGPETTMLSAPAAFPAQSTRSVGFQATATENLASVPGPPTTMLPATAALPAQSTRSIGLQGPGTTTTQSMMGFANPAAEYSYQAYAFRQDSLPPPSISLPQSQRAPPPPSVSRNMISTVVLDNGGVSPAPPPPLNSLPAPTSPLPDNRAPMSLSMAPVPTEPVDGSVALPTQPALTEAN